MLTYHYRARLTKEESQSIQQLRRKGFAVVFLSPGDVGAPINRGSIEAVMLQAGKSQARKTKEESA
jgi:hypothetical protein